MNDEAGGILAWSEWGPYSDCSVTCGTGYKSRFRKCIGKDCHGSSKMESRCVQKPCDGIQITTFFSSFTLSF